MARSCPVPGRTSASANWPSDSRGEFDELVIIPADAPDLPGLVLAKLFKVLHRVDLAVAPRARWSGRGRARAGPAAGAVDPR